MIVRNKLCAAEDDGEDPEASVRSGDGIGACDHDGGARLGDICIDRFL